MNKVLLLKGKDIYFYAKLFIYANFVIKFLRKDKIRLVRTLNTSKGISLLQKVPEAI